MEEMGHNSPALTHISRRIPMEDMGPPQLYYYFYHVMYSTQAIATKQITKCKNHNISKCNNIFVMYLKVIISSDKPSLLAIDITR